MKGLSVVLRGNASRDMTQMLHEYHLGIRFRRAGGVGYLNSAKLDGKPSEGHDGPSVAMSIVAPQAFMDHER